MIMNDITNENKQEQPKFYERKDVIKLSADIECKCGRLKDRPHCPECGRTKLTGFADTIIAVIPNTLDTIKDARVYRCACGNKYNDADWYFNCHAPLKIDWEATKARIRNKNIAELTNKWLARIQRHEHFSHNDRVKCKAETGQWPEDFKSMLHMYDNPLRVQQINEKMAQEDRIAKLAIKKELEKHIDECTYCMSNIDYCEVAQKLKDELEEKQ